MPIDFAPERWSQVREIYRQWWVGELERPIVPVELDGVQWIPGDGHPDCAHWPELYQRIHAANKKIQVIGSLDTLDAVITQIGTGKGLHLKLLQGSIDQATNARERLKTYGMA